MTGIGAALCAQAGARAFPVFEAVSRTTGVSPTAPATVNANDLLVALLVVDGSVDFDTGADPANDPFATDGWTLLFSTLSGTACRLVGYYKLAVGTEDGVAYNCIWTAATRQVTHIYRFSYPGGPPGGTLCEAATPATGTSAAPDPPSVTPSWGAGNTLWLIVEGSDDQTADVSAYPTNYTANGIYNEVSASNGVGLGSSYRAVNVASENPGAFTLAASQEWVAATIAIKP